MSLLALSIIFSVVLIAVLLFKGGRQVSLLWGALSIIVLGALVFAVYSESTGTLLYAKTLGEPGDAVSEFLCRYLEGDTQGASELSTGVIAMDMETYRSGSIGKLYGDALRESITFETSESTGHRELGASVNTKITYLPIKAVAERAEPMVEAELEEIIAGRSNDELYDSENMLRSEITEEAYLSALRKALSQSDDLLMTREFPVQLSYVDGKWLLDSPGELLRCTRGGVEDSLDSFSMDAAGKALVKYADVRKVYTIPEDAPAAPAPGEENYGRLSPEEAHKLEDMIDQAKKTGLMDGQDAVFDPTVDFYGGIPIEYYLDETIMAICWKEVVNGKCCTFVEVKIADPSQFRRKLSGDAFGSPVKAYCTELSASCNALVGMNADFYANRNWGTCVYRGKLERYDTRCDTLFVDRSGDFRIIRREDFTDRETVEKLIESEGIGFSVSFGPCLIENGEITYLEDNYGGLGEMHMVYSRAAICQVDSLHYLFASVNHCPEGWKCSTINAFADIIDTKGVKTAYNLDGGQTGEVVFRGEPYNHIDWGSERIVSDIIYFATALPEEE